MTNSVHYIYSEYEKKVAESFFNFGRKLLLAESEAELAAKGITAVLKNLKEKNLLGCILTIVRNESCAKAWKDIFAKNGLGEFTIVTGYKDLCLRAFATAGAEKPFNSADNTISNKEDVEGAINDFSKRYPYLIVCDEIAYGGASSSGGLLSAELYKENTLQSLRIEYGQDGGKEIYGAYEVCDFLADCGYSTLFVDELNALFNVTKHHSQQIYHESGMEKYEAESFELFGDYYFNEAAVRYSKLRKLAAASENLLFLTLSPFTALTAELYLDSELLSVQPLRARNSVREALLKEVSEEDYLQIVGELYSALDLGGIALNYTEHRSVSAEMYGNAFQPDGYLLRFARHSHDKADKYLKFCLSRFTVEEVALGLVNAYCMKEEITLSDVMSISELCRRLCDELYNADIAAALLFNFLFYKENKRMFENKAGNHIFKTFRDAADTGEAQSLFDLFSAFGYCRVGGTKERNCVLLKYKRDASPWEDALDNVGSIEELYQPELLTAPDEKSFKEYAFSFFDWESPDCVLRAVLLNKLLTGDKLDSSRILIVTQKNKSFLDTFFQSQEDADSRGKWLKQYGDYSCGFLQDAKAKRTFYSDFSDFIADDAKSGFAVAGLDSVLAFKEPVCVDAAVLFDFALTPLETEGLFGKFSAQNLTIVAFANTASADGLLSGCYAKLLKLFTEPPKCLFGLDAGESLLNSHMNSAAAYISEAVKLTEIIRKIVSPEALSHKKIADFAQEFSNEAADDMLKGEEIDYNTVNLDFGLIQATASAINKIYSSSLSPDRMGCLVENEPSIMRFNVCASMLRNICAGSCADCKEEQRLKQNDPQTLIEGIKEFFAAAKGFLVKEKAVHKVGGERMIYERNGEGDKTLKSIVCRLETISELEKDFCRYLKKEDFSFKRRLFSMPLSEFEVGLGMAESFYRSILEDYAELIWVNLLKMCTCVYKNIKCSEGFLISPVRD